jgi:cytochrome bd-type quinol oxidase subunit 2
MRAVRPWVVREGPALLGACAAALLIGALGLQLWHAPSFSVPWAYDQDALSLLAAFKGIHDHGWIWTDASLGAPHGLDYYDFGSLGPDNLHWAMAWIITRFTGQPGVVFNLFLLLTFPMTAAAGYLSLRWLDVQRGAACAVAIVFAVVPYHFFRGLNGHLLLADYAVVPLGVFLAVCVILRRPLFEGGWRSATTLRTLVICVLIACSGIYYAAFIVVLLAVAVLAARLERDDNNATLFNGMGALAAIVFVLVLNLLPTVLYHRAHGANDLTGQREADESLKFGLSLIEQVLPSPEHRFAPFRRLADEYWGVVPTDSEGDPWGGTLSVLGLLILAGAACVALVGGVAGRFLTDRRLRATALIGLAATLLGATGAGGAFVSFVLNPSLRAWNRISIVIVFCALVAVAVALEAIGRRLRHRAGAYAAVLVAVVVFAAWDQTGSGSHPNYAKLKSGWNGDARFVAGITRTLGGRGMVYQLPYMEFPETAPVNGMADYQPLRGPLHAPGGMRWSYGAMKGRPADFQVSADLLPLTTQLRAAALAGFDGVWLDRAGYLHGGDREVAQLKATAGVPLQANATGTLVFADLRPLRRALQATHAPAEQAAVRAALLQPLDVQYGHDISSVAHDAKGNASRGLQGTGTITLTNPQQQARTVRFTVTPSADLALTLDGQALGTLTARAPGDIAFTVQPGEHVLGLTTAGKRTVALKDPVIEDSALAALDDAAAS